MKKFFLVFLSLLYSSFNVYSAESEYDENSRILTIPSVKIGNTHVYDAELILNDVGNFEILGFSNTPPSTGVNEVCVDADITLEKFNLISDGMTLEQVNSIIGCKGQLAVITTGINGDRSGYEWNGENRFPRITLQLENNSVLGRAFLPPR